WEHVAPTANNASPRRPRSTASPPTSPPTMPPSATSPMGTPRVRSGPFGLDCSAAMTFGMVVHCRPHESAPRRRRGHERNSVDLFRFQGKCRQERAAYCVGSATYRPRPLSACEHREELRVAVGCCCYCLRIEGDLLWQTRAAQRVLRVIPFTRCSSRFRS